MSDTAAKFANSLEFRLNNFKDEVNSHILEGVEKEFYEKCSSSFDKEAPGAVGWGSRYSQDTRINVLLSYALTEASYNRVSGSTPLQVTSILDLGCGAKRMEEILSSRGESELVSYTGIDKRPEYGGQDAFLHEGSYDWVLSSGALSFLDFQTMRKMISKMLELCTKGIAFNLLDKSDFQTKSPVNYWDCSEVISELKKDYIHQGILLDCSYMPGKDFTIVIHKGVVNVK